MYPLLQLVSRWRIVSERSWALRLEVAHVDLTIIERNRKRVDMTQATTTYDLIIMGATGFTGRLVAEHIETHGCINWAIAGRNKEKLEAIQTEFAPSAKVIVADSLSNDAMSAPQVNTSFTDMHFN